MDLNCDVGEGFDHWQAGDDRELISLCTSVNVACGWHAGDPATMRTAVLAAREHGVAVGAHPGYPDLQGFGRRAMVLTPQEIEDAVLYQVGALSAFARSAGVTVQHVKPHGALYHRACRDQPVAEAVVRAAQAYDSRLRVIGQAGSLLIEVARAAGVPYAAEAFIDRRYEADGSLRARHLPGALLHAEAAVAQALDLAHRGGVRAGTTWLPIQADTLCIHSDTPGAVELVGSVRSAFAARGIPLAPPHHDVEP